MRPSRGAFSSLSSISAEDPPLGRWEASRGFAPDNAGAGTLDGGAGGAGGFGGFDFSGADFSDIFGDIFGDLFGGGRRGGRSNGPMRGANVRKSIRITFEEAVSDVKKN